MLGGFQDEQLSSWLLCHTELTQGPKTLQLPLNRVGQVGKQESEPSDVHTPAKPGGGGEQLNTAGTITVARPIKSRNKELAW